MEDIGKFEAFYVLTSGIWNIVCGFIVLLALLFTTTGDNPIAGLAAMCLSGFIWWVGGLMFNLGRILLTRIVAMTENVLEITKMLEKRFGEGDEANDGKGETE